MLPQNWGEPTGAPAIFEKQIEIKLLPLHPLGSHGFRLIFSPQSFRHNRTAAIAS
ncbi:MAG: hypothetical protein P8X89_03275 [Reinekea sp.]